MAIEFTWIDRVDGVNYVRAADANKLAEGVIQATNEINQLGATKSDKTTVAALDNAKASHVYVDDKISDVNSTVGALESTVLQRLNAVVTASTVQPIFGLWLEVV